MVHTYSSTVSRTPKSRRFPPPSSRRHPPPTTFQSPHGRRKTPRRRRAGGAFPWLIFFFSRKGAELRRLHPPAVDVLLYSEPPFARRGKSRACLLEHSCVSFFFLLLLTPTPTSVTHTMPRLFRTGSSLLQSCVVTCFAARTRGGWSVSGQPGFSSWHQALSRRLLRLPSHGCLSSVAMKNLPYFCRGEVVRGFGRGSKELGIRTGERWGGPGAAPGESGGRTGGCTSLDAPAGFFWRPTGWFFGGGGFPLSFFTSLQPWPL